MSAENSLGEAFVILMMVMMMVMMVMVVVMMVMMVVMAFKALFWNCLLMSLI